MKISIRKAIADDSILLTEISFAAKRYWNYPGEYFKIWETELTITPDYIDKNEVYVAEVNKSIAGYIAVVEVENDFYAGETFVKKGFWVEHIFILPKYIGQGIGSQLINWIKDYCKEKNIASLNIFSDPNAKGFYDKIGAIYITESPSSIEGRTVVVYELFI